MFFPSCRLRRDHNQNITKATMVLTIFIVIVSSATFEANAQLFDPNRFINELQKQRTKQFEQRGLRQYERRLSRQEKIQIQFNLNRRGYYVGTPDGNFGINTRNGIRQFQRSLGERQTGYLTRRQADLILSQNSNQQGHVNNQRGGSGQPRGNNFDRDNRYNGQGVSGNQRGRSGQQRDNNLYPDNRYNRQGYSNNQRWGAGQSRSNQFYPDQRYDRQGLPNNRYGIPRKNSQLNNIPDQTKNQFSLPEITGRIAILDGYLPDIYWRNYGLSKRLFSHNKYYSKLNKFFDLLTIAYKPEVTQDFNTATYLAENFLSEREKIDLLRVSGFRIPQRRRILEARLKDYRNTVRSLDEFSRREFSKEFAQNYKDKIIVQAPKLPIPFVYVKASSFKEYNFQRGVLELNGNYPNFIYKPQVLLGSYKAKHIDSRIDLSDVPLEIKRTPREAQQLVRELVRNSRNSRARTVYVAIFGKIISGKAVMQIEVEKVGLYKDALLEQPLKVFKIDKKPHQYSHNKKNTLLKPAQTALQKLRKNTKVASIKSLVLKISELSKNENYIDAVIKQGNSYKQANEFEQPEVLIKERKKIKSASNSDIWLGGQVNLGKYDLEKKYFTIQRFSFNALRLDHNNYARSIKINVAHNHPFNKLNVEKDLARKAVTLNKYRNFGILARVESVKASVSIKSNNTKGNLYIRIKELVVWVKSRRGKTDDFVLTHYKDKNTTDVADKK